MPGWFDPRSWYHSLRRVWRRSLPLRTISTTVFLSTVAALAVGIAISLSVGTSLLDSRRDQLVTLSLNATTAAERAFESEAGAQDAEIETLVSAAATAILTAAATTSDGTSYAIRALPGQEIVGATVDSKSPRLDVDAVISPELQAAVAADTEGRVYSQSTGIERADGTIAPAIATGSEIEVEGTRYGLYLVYDISDTQETLSIVQLALGLAGLALIVLIGAITWVVVRLVIGPVQAAAETSRRLAAGELSVRIPVRGDDVIATLARSFNGMADSLRGQITRLAELSSVQQRFVSDVSHELRTPLTTIRLAGAVLYDDRDSFSPETARTVELLHTQIERFESLLSDLLEMSRFDAGAADMEIESTAIAPLVEDVVASMSALADQRGSELVLVAEGGFVDAEVDPRRIRRILTNLLGNAIDHGEGRPIEIWVDSDEHAVAVAVRDYGVGIQPEHLGRVFDRFWRADPSRQRTTGGSGLGLAISLEDAVLHGGWLEAWSAPGQGSCFRLTLPRRRGAELRSSPLEMPPPSQLEELRGSQQESDQEVTR